MAIVGGRDAESKTESSRECHFDAIRSGRCQMNRNDRTRLFGVALSLATLMALCPSIMADPPTLMGGMVKKPKPNYKDRVVEFSTLDGVTIVADFYPYKLEPGQSSPAVILIHMYPKNRASWRAFASELRDKGMAVLAYDIRGNGDSIKPKEMNLADGYTKKSPEHFKNAAYDAMGAMEFFRQQEFIDMNRVAMIGASIGCSISMDSASRTNDIRGIVCLSPGTDYFGVDSLSHIKICASITPVLLLAPEAEYEAVQKLAEAGGATVQTGKYKGGAEHHGTNMLEAPYGKKVKKRITKFIMKSLSISEPAPAEDEPAKDGDKPTEGKKTTKGKKKSDKTKTSNGKKKPKPSDE
jgi:pimeloyl-ACP methyl ester carboxylesterase